MIPEIAAVLSGPRKLTLLRDGSSTFVEIEPLRVLPDHHARSAPADPRCEEAAVSDQSTLATAARRRLVWLLLETFGVNDVHAMLHRSLSGSDMTLEQVRSIRRTMRRKGFDKKAKPSLAHVRTAPIIGSAAEQLTRKPSPQPEPKPIAPTVGRAQCPIPESFESQMARLRAGARLVSTPDFRTPPPAFTLGGVGSASL